MSSIEALRCKLYLAWEKGSSQEILKASQELDVEIVKYMKSSLAAQKQRKGQDKHKIQNLIKKENVDMPEMPETKNCIKQIKNFEKLLIRHWLSMNIL